MSFMGQQEERKKSGPSSLQQKLNFNCFDAAGSRTANVKKGQRSLIRSFMNVRKNVLIMPKTFSRP